MGYRLEDLSEEQNTAGTIPTLVWQERTGGTDLIDQDWDRMVTFYNYPKQQWQHLRTTNPVESPFSALRLRTDAARRFKKVANA